MTITSVTPIFFSPTRTTKRVVEAIGHGVEPGTQGPIDLTPPDSPTRQIQPVRQGLAIIGAPVYRGRVPPEAARRLGRVRGHSTPAAVVAVYGNREFDDALLELRDIAVAQGFVPVAGAAFIGEHSYDSSTTPIATGRPDEADLESARQFGAAIRDRVGRLARLDSVPTLQVPGHFPYREPSHEAPGSPQTIDERCTRCGLCVTACPMAAIDAGDPLNTDEGLCICCSACVKACPTSARVWELAWVKRVSNWLAENYSARKEPEVFL